MQDGHGVHGVDEPLSALGCMRFHVSLIAGSPGIKSLRASDVAEVQQGGSGAADDVCLDGSAVSRTGCGSRWWCPTYPGSRSGKLDCWSSLCEILKIVRN